MARLLICALEDDRCVYTIPIGRRGEVSRCSRAHVDGHLCTQHKKMAARWSCKYCGGNDEFPQDHCQDCTRPGAANPT